MLQHDAVARLARLLFQDDLATQMPATGALLNVCPPLGPPSAHIHNMGPEVLFLCTMKEFGTRRRFHEPDIVVFEALAMRSQPKVGSHPQFPWGHL